MNPDDFYFFPTLFKFLLSIGMGWFSIAATLAADQVLSSRSVDFPIKPIRFIVPFPAGGPRDAQARLLAGPLTARWGHPVVVDNRAGANGIIGLDAAAKSIPDGYTLVMISLGFALGPSLSIKLPYDTLHDFTAIGPLSRGPGLLVVHPSLPAHSVRQLIDYSIKNPQALNFGSAGNGSPSHLSMQLLQLMSGARLTHVPYKGMAPAINDVVSAQIQLSLPTITAALPFVSLQRLRALAVSGSERSAMLPAIPTIAEAGVENFEATNWYGVATAAHTPLDRINQLNKAIEAVQATDEMKQKLYQMGLDSFSGSARTFDEFVHAEVKKWATVVKKARL
jgi:tripartite-type tricarboxylate transporter receptor subunit TctC